MLGNFTESLKGTVGGVVLLIASFPILFKNEGCAVDIAKGLDEGESIVVSIDASKDVASYNGKLIHTTGEAKAGARITDPEFGVETAALVLERDVEMYQWKETTREDSQTKQKTYTYDKEWTSLEIDSGGFHDTSKRNPPFPYSKRKIVADSVSMGNLTFSDSLKGQISAGEKLNYDQTTVNRLKASLGNRAKITDGEIYVGRDPLSPEVGDVKVHHMYGKEGIASIIGQLTGSIVDSFTTKRETQILMFDYGTKDAISMFQKAQDDNVTRTWVVRVAGFFIMFLGFRLLFGPIAAAGGWIPILGGILEMGVSIVAGILAFSFSFVTISIAWIFFRPLLGLGLLALGVGAFAYLYQQKGKFTKNPSPQA